ncbi:hypothetical protein Lal_00011421, partial [Lupinus albus]
MNEKLTETDRLKSEFLTVMSHELRTPLTAIIAFAEILLDEGQSLSSLQREYLQDIFESGHQLLDQINDILNMSKIEAGLIKLNCTEVDIREIVISLLRNVTPLAHKKGLLLRTEFAEAIPLVLADREKLMHVLRNLISNALKFTPAQGKITISAALEEQLELPAIKVAVKDTGIGISLADQAYIFEKFRQVDSAETRGYPGSGLGKPVYFYTAGYCKGVLALTSEKILVVDDDARILKIVKHCLEKEAFQVVTAVDGESALNIVKQEQPSLVVLDLMLPKLNGYDVCRALTDQYSIPIIILSAKGDELDRIVGFRLGVDDYMTKPFSPTELVLRVQAVIRRVQGSRKSQENQVLVCGELTIDHGTRTVSVEGKPVSLTSTEFELLWLLAGSPQQVFTRMQLLNKIWQSNYQGDENTVTVHVRRLREKIEPNPAEPRYIRTRRLFSNITQRIGPGECLAVTGPNGSGKSTLLKIIAGLVRPTSGVVKVWRNGQELVSEQRLASCGLVSPEIILYQTMTGYENLEFLIRARGVTVNDEWLFACLDKVGLAGRQQELVNTYS